VAFLVTLFLQLGIDSARQIVFTIFVAVAWEFEKRLLDLTPEENSTFADLIFLVAGLMTGAISVYVWPQAYVDQFPFRELSAIVSPIVSAFALQRSRRLLHPLGLARSELMSFRHAVVFAIGISVTRTIMLP
jgi:hypothetical protein